MTKRILRVTELKNRSFEEIVKPLMNLTKIRKEKMEFDVIRNEKDKITMDSTEIQIISNYFKNLYSN